MKLIAVSDIFGITRCFEDLLSDLKETYTSIESVDPYRGVKHEFSCEKDAYVLDYQVFSFCMSNLINVNQ